MKTARLCAAALAAAALIILFAALPQKTAFEGADSYAFFCGDTSRNFREVRADGNAGIMKLVLNDISGECATYSQFDVEGFLKAIDGEIQFTEEIAGTRNLYISGNLPYSVTLYGTTINAQICIGEDGVKVASPIIFGGY